MMTFDELCKAVAELSDSIEKGSKRLAMYQEIAKAATEHAEAYRATLADLEDTRAKAELELRLRCSPPAWLH